MKCADCNRNASIETPFGERHYCKKHFLESIEKRIRKELRIHQKMNTKKKYFLLNDNSHEYFLTKHFLETIFSGYLKFKDTKDEKEADILPTSLDSQTDEFIEAFLKNRKLSDSKKIYPLKVVSQKEMKELCKILKIKFKAKGTDSMLDKLEEEYPGTKFATLKSKEFVNKK